MSVTSSGTPVAPPPVAPGPGRLPTIRRERRPALAALAVLLILGGGLISGLGVYRSGQRADYVVLNHDVKPGQRLTRGDLRTARIAGTGARAVPASRLNQVAGQYMTVGGFAGALLTPEMIESQQPFPPDGAVVGVVVDAGQAPAGGIQIGDIVRVLRVPARGGDGDPGVLVGAARVIGVSASGGDSGVLGSSGSISTGSTVVNVLVPAAMAAPVAAASVQRQVALVLLPPSTTPVVGGL